MAAGPSKYEVTERERKFLLGHSKSLVSGSPFILITDHYIKNTGLRLRVMDDSGNHVYKLTKKSDSTKGKSQLTTIYLSEPEFKLLNVFSSVSVEKERFILKYHDIIIGIDRYNNLDDELWMAEVEFKSDEEMENFILPFNYLKEVTDNPAYNGFTLAEKFGADSNT